MSGLNLASAFDAIAAAYPTRECLVWRTWRITWGEMAERTDRVASVLRAAGLGCHTERDAGLAGWESGQDLVALYLYNSPEYLEAMLGAYKARCAPANVNFRATPAELAAALDNMSAQAVVYHASLEHTLAVALEALLPHRRPRLLLRVDDHAGTASLPGSLGWSGTVGAAVPTAPLPLQPDDLYVLYTGGTTGQPRGVLWRQADFVVGALGFTLADPAEVVAGAARGGSRRVLPAPPFMHGAAQWFVWSAWLAGGTVVLPHDPPRVDPADLVATIAAEAVSSLQLVGDSFGRPLLEYLQAHPAIPLPNLRHLVSGGAPLSAGVKAGLLERLPGLTILDIMGSSESGRLGVASVADPARATTGTFDPSDGATVLDEALTRELAPGEPAIGWLARTGPVPLGYLGDEPRTQRTFPVIGGHRYAVPGDRARRRADGSIEVLGRDAATINTGGEKVFAEEVELALLAHPAVADALVVGRPSERWGQEVVAVIALVPGWEHVTDAELKAACATTLAGFKCPKAFIRVNEVRRTPSGKPDYRWARALASGT